MVHVTIYGFTFDFTFLSLLSSTQYYWEYDCQLIRFWTESGIQGDEPSWALA